MGCLKIIRWKCDEYSSNVACGHLSTYTTWCFVYVAICFTWGGILRCFHRHIFNLSLSSESNSCLSLSYLQQKKKTATVSGCWKVLLSKVCPILNLEIMFNLLSFPPFCIALVCSLVHCTNLSALSFARISVCDGSHISSISQDVKLHLWTMKTALYFLCLDF